MVQKAPPRLGQIKMLVLDLDGTLLRTDKTVGPRTIQALHAAHDRGVAIVLNSGRMTAAMEPTEERIGIDCHIIAYNGATATSPKAEGRKCLFAKPLNLEIARELAVIARERRLQFNYYRDELVYSEDYPEVRPYREIYWTRTHSPFRFVERIEDHMDVPPLKVLFVVSPEMREAMFEELTPRFGRRSNMTRTDPEYLEFLHPEVDKGVGVKGLCDAMKIPLSAVMAVGDGDNDGPMVACAGWGVAVRDARESVLKVAAAQTEADCDHDAVAEAIERWILNG